MRLSSSWNIEIINNNEKDFNYISFFLMIILAWALPYFKDLRDQYLNEIAYAYFFGRPDHIFDPKDATQLYYSKWILGHHQIKDENNPLGEIGINQLNSKVDVFFVHPTEKAFEFVIGPINLDEESATKKILDG